MQNTAEIVTDATVASPAAAEGDSLFFIVFVAIIMLVSMLSAVSAVVSFLLTMTVLRVPEEHRKLTLGSLWLIMVPVYGVYQMWLTTQRLAASFQAYFDAQEPP